jgi:hypothetical protein
MIQDGARRSESRVLAAVLKRLLRGEAADLAAIAQDTGMAPADIDAALAELDAVGALYRRDGRMVAAYPLAGATTRHRIRVGRATAYANCAVDALAVPTMVDEPVAVESTCPQCDIPIVVETRDDRLLSVRPGGTVVYVVSAECCAPGPAVLTRCPHINFFCNAAHATAWAEAHRELRGTVMRVSDAAASARARFAPVTRAVRGEDVPLTELSRLRASG